MAGIRDMFPVTRRAVRRLRLTISEYLVLRCQRDRLDLGQDVSTHDSELLTIANLIRDFREEYYGQR